MASIVTLTSDFGWRDSHLGLLKGALLRAASHIQLVDLTHDVHNYDLVQAAYLFAPAWQAFPTGTIHVVSVNSQVSPSDRLLVFAHEGHYFVGPDNGIFSLVFGPRPPALYQLPLALGQPHPLAATFALAVGALATGSQPESFAQPTDHWVERLRFQPIIGPNQIRGSVIYIDKYENAVLNISRQLFEQVGRGRPFGLFFKRHEPITTLSDHYSSAPVGEPLCRFSSTGYLEIAINLGRAASLLSIKVEDSVQIDFYAASSNDLNDPTT